MSSSNSPCAACKLLRRKCTQGCVFAPYFPPDQPAKFANVHKVFGASNVTKLLNDLPQAQREDAVNSLAYEADARLRDPVYGCVAYISILQLKIKQVRDEIAAARKELAGYIGPAAFSPIVTPPLHHPAAAAQYAAAGMGLGVGVAPPHAHQAQMAMQHPHHHQQMVEAQHMAAAVEVAREQNMMMRQAYAHAAVPGGSAAGAATVAVLPPGSAEAAAYEDAPFLLQQQPPPSAQTAVALTYRMEQSPPPQSSGHSHAEVSHAQQHTDGSDDGSGVPRGRPDGRAPASVALSVCSFHLCSLVFFSRILCCSFVGYEYFSSSSSYDIKLHGIHGSRKASIHGSRRRTRW